MQDVRTGPDYHPSRGTAFAIHLILSLLVFSTLVAAMLVYWFPGKLFLMDGGWQGLKLVAMVDLVLGPALTLILYKPGKKNLKFDLCAIAVIQVLALGYGFYTTYNQRTVAVVFADNEFATVSAQDNKQANALLIEREIQPKPLPAVKPFQIPVLMTPAPENFGEYFAQLMNGFPAGHERSDQYVEIAADRDTMTAHIRDADTLAQLGALTTIENALEKKGTTLDKVEVYDFRARFADGFVLFDPDSATIRGYVSFSPSDNDQSVAENES